MNVINGKVLLLIGCIVLISCKEKHVETNQIIKEWIGKVVELPDIEPSWIRKSDTVTVQNVHDYKILVYTDSSGCTACRLNTGIWKSYIEETGSRVSFLFYFQAKNKRDMLLLLKREVFVNYPVYIDTANMLNGMNKLPDNPLFQCFLLDRNNKVLLIGNPTASPKIWELYKEIINGKDK